MLSKAFSLFVLASCVLATPLDVARRAAQACPATPDTSSYTNANLPDLFTFADGTTKVTTKADWTCRQAEILALMEKYELGDLPAPPQSVTATLSGNSLAITVTDQGKSITFTPTIQNACASASCPAIIAYGAPSIPIPAGIVVINFNNDDIAAQASGSSRGQGKFFNLYGSSHSAGATTAWAWGVGRIIDALEKTPAAKIDTKRIGVTGCSRNGKGALIAGALESRVALTLPQESGSGGTDSWRISDYINSHGTSTQTASEIVDENVWYSSRFNTYAKSSVNKMPFDHHSLIALIAPRALFAIDQAAIDWLGAPSSYGDLIVARRAWTALGVTDHMGFSQSSAHNHCSFPAGEQTAPLNAFINKFLLNQTTNTDIAETKGNWASTYPGTWATWSTPTLT